MDATETRRDEVILVRGTADVKSTAMSIVHALRADSTVSVRAIGAQATSQAVKACSVAREVLGHTQDGDMVVRPSFGNTRGPTGGDNWSVNILRITLVER